MTLSTLKALKESIAHWERILIGKDRSLGRSACALCGKFTDDCQAPRSHERCPVDKTGKQSCYGSPYTDFSRAWLKNQGAHTEETIILAWKELEFLRSLLPKNKEKR
jgi:hypothetical protein